jgi:hypothetical protein
MPRNMCFGFSNRRMRSIVMPERVQSLALEEASPRFERFASVKAATLHPAYVAADATRNKILQPLFLLYETQGESWLHGLHLTDVPGTSIRDASSPYGYGGPLSTSDDPGFLRLAWGAYTAWMREHRVAVEYVRFHPVAGNDRYYLGGTADNRVVVSVDLRVEDLTSRYAARLRQTLKKADASGLTYEEFDLLGREAEFGSYYRSAMREMQTDAFYLFDDLYFESLARLGFARLGVCRHSSTGERWLAAAIFLDGTGVREYHLAATDHAGRKAGASSFLLHQAALVGQSLGMEQLYLGGGTDRQPDNTLLFFKSAFSSWRMPYRTGGTVFDAAAYDELKARFPAEWEAHPERPIFYRKV